MKQEVNDRSNSNKAFSEIFCFDHCKPLMYATKTKDKAHFILLLIKFGAKASTLLNCKFTGPFHLTQVQDTCHAINIFSANKIKMFNNFKQINLATNFAFDYSCTNSLCFPTTPIWLKVLFEKSQAYHF